MRFCLMWSILGTAACSNSLTLPEYQAPDRLEITATQPATLPALPQQMKIITHQGNQVVMFTPNEAGQIDLFRKVAEANQIIAQETAAELIATKQAFNHLADAVDSQKVLNQMLADMLTDERQARKLDGWYYKAIIGAGLIAVAVSQ